MRKRILTATLAAMLMLSGFTACGNSGNTEENVQTEEKTEAVTDEENEVIFENPAAIDENQDENPIESDENPGESDEISNDIPNENPAATDENQDENPSLSDEISQESEKFSEEKEESAESADTSATDVSEEDIEVPEGYSLVWHDEFNGTELNEDDWNREKHQKGWVNHELQEYIPSADYAFVKDGELVIQPVKIEDEDGKVSYASGRVNTQNKHDIKYGMIEARIKFPEGKGFLPAFWMMPQDESYYGQWPKCGEIDIAEVLGAS